MCCVATLVRLIFILHPCQALHCTFATTAECDFTDPGAICGIPDLNVTVFAADSKAERLAAEGGPGGMGEGEAVYGGGRKGDCAEAVDVHGVRLLGREFG